MNKNDKSFLMRLRRWLSGGGKAEPSDTPTATPQPVGSHQTSTAGAERTAKPTPAPAAPATAHSDAAPEHDRVVRVFISSTFKDMVEDRNELMTQTWPALRRLCRARAVEFVEVDLRWGITEEQSQRKETVQYCLAEIKRCRPYFIGLLGERYGWVPQAEAFPSTLLEQEGWLQPEIAKRSATELEILHGVLNNPDMAGRAFFYFRDPAYAQARGGDFQAEDAASATRQLALKDRIRTLCQAKTMPLREGDQYGDSQRLASLVLADLTAAIEAEFPADQVPDVWAREARDHESYAKSRRSPYYIGRNAYFERLDTYARDGADGCGLTVLGESGGGKSALLANWLGHWRATHPDAFVFQQYIGSSPMSAGHLALMRRLMVAIIRWCADPATPRGFDAEEERLPAQSEEIVKVFPEYLSRLAYTAKQRGVPALIVLDALNQLEDRERGRLLGWLPYRLPLDMRLIVSTLPGDTLEALEPRAWSSLTVEPLRAEERVQLITRYLRHFSRGLSEPRARAIAASPTAANPLYLKTLLDDLRATGVNRELDRQIADYLQAVDIPALLVKILARYERDYERDRPGLVKDALSLIWAARRGLTEPELLAVLKPEGQAQLPAAWWSPIRCALEDGLVDHSGILAFGHEHLRLAAGRYFRDQDAIDEQRLRLADYFEAQPISARTCDELPWLLRQVEARDRLRQCLLDIERFQLILTRDQHELLTDWVWLGEERTMGKLYLAAFSAWESKSEIDASQPHFGLVANRLGGFLGCAGLDASAEPLFRRVVGEGPVPEFEGGSAEDMEATLRNRRVSLCNLAQVLAAKGDAVGAESLYRQVLSDGELVRELDPQFKFSILDDLACLVEKHSLGAAEILHRQALEGSERTLGLTHPSTLIIRSNLATVLYQKHDLKGAQSMYRMVLDTCRNTLDPGDPLRTSALNNLANLLMEEGDLVGAEPLFRQALEARMRALGPLHTSTLLSLNNLATLLEANRELGEAESLYRQALEGYRATRGPQNPATLMILNNLAGVLYAKGQLFEAERLYQQALVGYQRSAGPEHPDLREIQSYCRELRNLKFIALFFVLSWLFFTLRPISGLADPIKLGVFLASIPLGIGVGIVIRRWAFLSKFPIEFFALIALSLTFESDLSAGLLDGFPRWLSYWAPLGVGWGLIASWAQRSGLMKRVVDPGPKDGRSG